MSAFELESLFSKAFSTESISCTGESEKILFTSFKDGESNRSSISGSSGSEAPLSDRFLCSNAERSPSLMSTAERVLVFFNGGRSFIS